jgi:EAL domain-containing protein (putative c-di-GMP-specific phosphodiesterase class I)
MIDRGFASNLNSDGEDAAVVQAAIVRAKRFGLSLIAEGTSNEVPQSKVFRSSQFKAKANRCD